ncbi:carboxymuconolactone decarboxylase family protein [Blastococcus xanthinilyticus]|uniref:AhpD family alkylhydroperoxidase n=1 Tax=Blastococcus xanthinilyticus TaxID=1564164 RepID=A0A5S5CSK3_9ACTN|nr:carboxymuconolactone decarboxylase family protein [Blastococcus xanthinilyticus]TYP86740.1 AhpD family alkylhydroperoxidase [Blastococcus xanthinilyticus]
MASTRIPATEVTGVRGALVTAFSRRMFGRVPESIGVLWHHPAVFTGLMGLGRKADSWRHLDRELATFASMAAAGVVGCGFCLDLHYFMSHHRGLDEARAREVPRWRQSTVFSPVERRVMEYAEAMSQTPPAVTDELSAALLADLGAPALVELTARVGAMNLSARTNVALGIRSEEFAASCGLAPLAARPAEGHTAA